MSDNWLDDPQVSRLWKELYSCMILDAYLLGSITLDELTDSSIVRNKVLKPIKSHLHKKHELRFSIDYRKEILKDARRYKAAGDYNNALVFYALYFEHEINGLFRRILERKKYSEETIEQPMRLSLKDKCTWLADILEVKRPSKKFVSFLIPFSDYRNGYVHYKWKGINPDNDQVEAAIQQQLNDIEKQITYVQAYSSRILFGGKKKKVLRSIKLLVNK